MFTYRNSIFPRRRYVLPRVQNGSPRSHLVYLHKNTLLYKNIYRLYSVRDEVKGKNISKINTACSINLIIDAQKHQELLVRKTVDN